jgi:hypothetical protein
MAASFYLAGVFAFWSSANAWPATLRKALAGYFLMNSAKGFAPAIRSILSLRLAIPSLPDGDAANVSFLRRGDHGAAIH